MVTVLAAAVLCLVEVQTVFPESLYLVVGGSDFCSSLRPVVLKSVRAPIEDVSSFGVVFAVVKRVVTVGVVDIVGRGI